jgi:hypothetical protein
MKNDFIRPYAEPWNKGNYVEAGGNVIGEFVGGGIAWARGIYKQIMRSPKPTLPQPSPPPQLPPPPPVPPTGVKISPE